MRPRAHRTSAVVLSALFLTALPLPASAARPPKPPSGPSTISWSGHDWDVKEYSRKIGPGPNFFSSSNVRVDPDGSLHLAITKSGSKWTTAEVILKDSFGYGTYTWVLRTPAPLDPNVVLGLFTWNDDPAENHREIDIEFAKWGNASDPNDAQFVVQPYDSVGNEHRFVRPAGGALTTLSFTWASDGVAFRASSDGVAQTWTYGGADIPLPGGENPRMNLWLFRGAAPTDGRSVEVVFESFTFTRP